MIRVDRSRGPGTGVFVRTIKSNINGNLNPFPVATREGLAPLWYRSPPHPLPMDANNIGKATVPKTTHTYTQVVHKVCELVK